MKFQTEAELTYREWLRTLSSEEYSWAIKQYKTLKRAYKAYLRGDF